MTIENVINIFTDGSCLSKPLSGDIGVRIVTINSQGQEETEDVTFYGYSGTTNNQIGLFACVEGIKPARSHSFFEQCSRIAVFTYSTSPRKPNSKQEYNRWSQVHCQYGLTKRLRN